MTHWTDCKSWEENWTKVADLPGGGQASAKRVRRKDTGEVAFLKLLNRQKDSERRTRFLREASAYDAFRHSNIPALIETNAHRHEDSSTNLYIVLELIEGSSLSEAIEARRPDFGEAAATALRLLEVVKHFHELGWVHRDIKPDNIVLRDGKLADPVLVDFGLGHRDALTPGFETEAWQEIGNRFLRLPELGSDSPLKQDSRTDLAFVGGILFYCLTGSIPAQLLDAEWKMPHQRLAAMEILRSAAPSVARRLSGIFDRSFSYRLSGRFATASEMETELAAALAEHLNGDDMEEEDGIEALRGLANSSASAELARLKTIYDAGISAIEGVHGKVLAAVAPNYVTFWTGYLNFSQGFKKTLGFNHFSTLNHRFAPTFTIVAAGDEIIVRMDDEVVHRTDADEPDFDDDGFKKRVEDAYVAGMKRLMAAPISGN